MWPVVGCGWRRSEGGGEEQGRQSSVGKKKKKRKENVVGGGSHAWRGKSKKKISRAKITKIPLPISFFLFQADSHTISLV